jgi:hypothetical protein
MIKDKIFSFYRFSAYLLMLGVIHCALTPVFYKSFSLDAIWFFGTGLSLVFLSLLNIAASRLLVPWLLTITLIANIIGTLHSIAILYVLNAPQAYIGLLFFVTVLLACWAARRQIVNTNS